MAYKFTHKKTEYTIPAFNEIPVGVIRKARKAKDETDMAFTILEQTLGIDSPELEAIDSMLPDEFQTWLTGWTQGVSVGEPAGSLN